MSFLTIALIVAFVLTVGAYSKSTISNKWKTVNVIIKDSDKHSFVSEAQIKLLLSNFKYKLNKTHIDSIKVDVIKSRVMKNKYVDRATVYTSCDGSLNIVIDQFVPYLLIQSAQSLYMFDVKGNSRVVNCAINKDLPYITTDLIKIDFQKFFKSSVKKHITNEEIIKIICNFAKVVKDDGLLSNYIVQINVNSYGEVELIPRFGAKLITFCDLYDIENYDIYIDKLKRFLETLSNTNKVGDYDFVNLKVENQVIAKKTKK